MKTKTLTIKNLITLFGVTAMTIHTWRKGTATKEKMPEVLTPAAVKRWAIKHSVDMTCDPASLLGTGIGKPGPKPRPHVEELTNKPVRRSAQVRSAI